MSSTPRPDRKPTSPDHTDAYSKSQHQTGRKHLIAILRHLAQPQTYLTISGMTARIVNSANARSKAVDATFARRLVSSGALDQAASGYVLNQAGRQTLKRLLAHSDVDPQDAFQSQHQSRRAATLKSADGKDNPVLINDAESPLGWLYRRKGKCGQPLISTCQFEAGERLARDFSFAQQSPRVTASWSATASSTRDRRGPADSAALMSDQILAARQRVARALRSVGPELSGILVDVCCHMIKITDAEKANTWPQRSGKVILDLALTRLARHYGMDTSATTSGKSSRIVSWHDGGHQADLSAWID